MTRYVMELRLALLQQQPFVTDHDVTGPSPVLGCHTQSAKTAPAAPTGASGGSAHGAARAARLPEAHCNSHTGEDRLADISRVFSSPEGPEGCGNCVWGDQGGGEVGGWPGEQLMNHMADTMELELDTAASATR